MSALLKFGAQQENNVRIGSPTPDPGSLYEKHKGPRKYEGAGGNLKGGVTYDLPWAAVQAYLKDKLGRPKRDTAKWKNINDVHREYNSPVLFDALSWFVKYIGRWPSIHEVSKIYDTMLTARPEELGDVLVNAGFARSDRHYDRAARNERNTAEIRKIFSRLADQGQGPAIDVKDNPYGDGTLIGSPHYNSFSNQVNWTPRYAMIHELGHAIDFNDSILGNEYMDPDSTKAKLRAWLRLQYIKRALVGQALGTLNIEHKGWSRGFDAYLEGAAMQGKTWDDIKHIIREAAETKNPALGSYWKAYGGDVAGNALGLGTAGGVYKYLKPELGKSLQARGVRGALGALSGVLASYASSPFFTAASRPLIDSIVASRGTRDSINEQVQDLKEDFDEKRREHA